MSDVGKYERCKTCRRYGWTNTHTCPPSWSCGQDRDCVDGEGFGKEPSEAAEWFVQYVMESYGPEGEETTVYVQNGDEVEEYCVTTSYDVNYNAEKVER